MDEALTGSCLKTWREKRKKKKSKKTKQATTAGKCKVKIAVIRANRSAWTEEVRELNG